MLIISDEQVRELLPMDETIKAMEDSYREVAEGTAQNSPRARLRTPPGDDGLNYFFNCIPGMLPSRGIMSVRIDSVVRGYDPERAHVNYVGNRYCGWIILYSLRTGEPLAIIDDFTISGVRVGATVGMVVNYLARKDASRVALYGTGKQARTNLEGVSKVRRLEEVRVYSPNPEHRKLFVEEMTPVIGAKIIPVDSSEKAMEDADIVLCTSNSMTPVFDGKWLRPGMTVSSITSGGDRSHIQATGRVRKEIDDLTIERAELIVISSWAQVAWDDQSRLANASQTGEKVIELGDLLTGKAQGRRSDEELNLFANNTGTGNQFAAAGYIVYEKAKERGVGREIPTEWLMTDLSKWAERGFSPSP